MRIFPDRPNRRRALAVICGVALVMCLSLIGFSIPKASASEHTPYPSETQSTKTPSVPTSSTAKQPSPAATERTLQAELQTPTLASDADDTSTYIAGRVSLGNSSNPASAGEVWVYYDETQWGITFSHYVETDASGDYTISVPNLSPAVGYVLYFQYKGTGDFSSAYLADPYSSGPSPNYSAASVEAVPGETTTANMTLLSRASITGVVSLGSAANIAPAGTVTVSYEYALSDDAIDPPSTPVKIGSGGRYVLPNLSPGHYFLDFVYSGGGPYQSKWYLTDDVTTQSTLLGLSAVGSVPVAFSAGSDLEVDFTLPPTRSVSGHVYLGTTNFSATAGEIAISYSYQNANVEGPDQWITTSATTDSNGNFTVTGLIDGWYIFQFSDSESTRYLDADTDQFEVTSTTVPSVLTTLIHLVSVTGHIDLENSSDTAVSSAPANSVEVKLITAPGGIAWSYTWDPVYVNASGNFDFPGIPDQTAYSLEYIYLGNGGGDCGIDTLSTGCNYNDAYYGEAQNTWDDSGFDKEYFTPDGSNLVLPDFTWEYADELQGTVTDENGAPIPNLVVYATATPPGGSPWNRWAETNASGQYLIRGLQNADWTISYPLSDEPYQEPPLRNVELDNSGLVTEPVQALEPADALSGVVTAAGSTKGLANVQVTAKAYSDPDGLNEINSYATTTDAEGNYSFTDMQDGYYEIDFDDEPAYAFQSYDGSSAYYEPDFIPVFDGETVDHINAALYPGATVHGAVSLPIGSQEDVYEGGVLVEVEVLDGPTNSWVETGDFYYVSGSVGDYTYSIPDLAPGDYRLRVIYDGYSRFGESESSTFAVGVGKSVTKNLSISTLGIGINNVEPGMLVKSTNAGSSTVYLVDGDDFADGDDNLVPVSALDYVSSMGLSTHVSAIDPFLVGGMTVLAAPLTSVVSCSGSDFIAGSGKLWPIASALVQDLPSTQLQSSTCDAIPTSSTTINHALFVKSSSSSTIWYVNLLGQKSAVTSTAEMDSLSAPDEPVTLTVASEFIAGLADGPDITYPGELVKTPSQPALYMADGMDRLVPVQGTDFMTALGLSTVPVTVTPATIAAETVASASLSAIVSCSDSDYIAASGQLWPVSSQVVGTLAVTALEPSTCALFKFGGTQVSHALLVRTNSSETIWYVDSSGSRHAISGSEAMDSLTSPDAPVILTVAAEFIAALPEGDPMFSPGGLLVSDGVTYLVDGSSHLIPITSSETVTDMGIADAPVEMPASAVSGFTIASTPLSSVVSCSGSDFIGGSGKLWPVAANLAHGLRVTVLDPSTCAVIPTASAEITRGLFVKSSDLATVWEIDAAGRRDATHSSATLQALSSPGAPAYLTVPQDFIAALPVGPDVLAAGTVIRSTTGAGEYLATGSGGVVPVPNPDVLADLGLSATPVSVSPETITDVAAPLSNLFGCEGGDYLAGSGQIWQVAGAAAGAGVNALPASLCAVLTAHAGILSSAVVRAETTGDEYTLVGGAKVPVAGDDATSFVDVNDAWLDSLPTN